MSASFRNYHFSFIPALNAPLLPPQRYLPGYANIIRTIQKTWAQIKRQLANAAPFQLYVNKTKIAK